MTPDQRGKLLSSKAPQVSGKLLGVNHCGESPPTKLQAQHMLKNESKRRRKSEQATKQPSAVVDRVWTVDDINEALSQMGLLALNTLPDEAKGLDELVLLEAKVYMDAKGTRQYSAVLSSRELLATPQRFDNETYFKVVADASFRELFGKWSTIPFGLLSKDYRQTIIDGHNLCAWTSHFKPVLYVLTSSENETAYTMGYRWLSSLPAEPNGDTIGAAVRQAHGDWAPQIEAARRKVLDASVRSGDFRHFWIAVKDGLKDKE